MSYTKCNIFVLSYLYILFIGHVSCNIIWMEHLNFAIDTLTSYFFSRALQICGLNTKASYINIGMSFINMKKVTSSWKMISYLIIGDV